jgi:hypothetical protein
MWLPKTKEIKEFWLQSSGPGGTSSSAALIPSILD